MSADWIAVDGSLFGFWVVAIVVVGLGVPTVRPGWIVRRPGRVLSCVTAVTAFAVIALVEPVPLGLLRCGEAASVAGPTVSPIGTWVHGVGCAWCGVHWTGPEQVVAAPGPRANGHPNARVTCDCVDESTWAGGG